MKRLDLIFSERELDAIIKTLEKANVPGYTVMKHATGRGPCLLYTSPSPRD